MSNDSGLMHGLYKWFLSTLSALSVLGFVFVLEAMH